MDNIEAKALALVNGVKTERGRNSYSHYTRLNRALDDGHEALFRAIEQHEAFRQEVSDVVEKYFSMDWNTHHMASDLHRFISPRTKPDPLVEIIGQLEDGSWGETKAEYASKLRAALEACGLEIRGINT